MKKQYLFFILSFFLGNMIIHAQTCTDAASLIKLPASGSFTANGVTVTTSSTAGAGNITGYTEFLNCIPGNYPTDLFIMYAGTTTMNFSKPVNQIVFYVSNMGAGGSPNPEILTFTTNSGTPTVTDGSIKCGNISATGNTIIGYGNGPQNGGFFVVTSPTPFTQLVFSGNSSTLAGVPMAICEASIIEACTGPDTDGDGVSDICDLDSDNDGIPNCIENGFDGDPNTAFKSNADAIAFTNPPGTAPVNQFRLTNGTSQRGQAWSYGKIDFADGFSITMKVLLSGADGIAMVFQNDPLGISASGIHGQGLGARGIVNGIALELDTFQNSCDNDANNGGNCDPSYDHGSIRTTAGTATSGWTKLAGDGQLGDGTVDDGLWHTVVVTWNATTRNLSYTFGGVSVTNYTFPASGTNSIESIFGGTTQVRFGFTGSTGLAGSNNSIGFDNPCEIPLYFDTDGDGILDYLDLDSDNDGCPDAIEGGDNVLVSHLNPDGSINTSTTGGIDVNGIPNLVNSGGAADIGEDQGQGIGASQNNSINICTDTDGDGIPDYLDLDDDNDGILDTDECSGEELVVNGIFPTNTHGWTVSNWAYRNFNGGIAWTNADGATPGVNLLRQTLNGLEKGIINLNFSMIIFGGTAQRLDVYVGSTRYASFVSSSNPTTTITATAENGATINVTTFPEGTSWTSGWQDIEITFPYNLTETSQELRFDTYTTGGGFGDDVGIDNVSVKITNCDTDEDGIPNRLDLDSDNDGCLDAIEGDENVTTSQLVDAGGTVTVGTGSTAANQNLCADRSCVDAQGVPVLVNSGGAADIGGDQGQGFGASRNKGQNACIDTDEDSVPDYLDLDNDNDGIMDTDECPPVYTVRPVVNSTITATGTITNGDIRRIADGEGTGGTGSGLYTWYTNTNNLPIQINMDIQDVSVIDHIKLYGPWGINEWIKKFKIELYDSSNVLLGTENLVAPDQYSGTPILGFSQEYANVSSITLTIISGQGYSSANPLRASLGEIAFLDLQICDTDGDGIENRFDLDSDNDGCLDAIEGGDDVTSADLVDAVSSLSVGTGSAAENQNLCADASCVDSDGVPVVVNAGGTADVDGSQGQGVGFAASTLMNECAEDDNCYKPGAIGTALTSSVAITTKGHDPNVIGWPQTVPNGYLVLDGAEKGFVITHMTIEQRDLLTPVEGMMIYNTTENCVQLYRGTSPTVDTGRTGWNCIEQDCDGVIAPRNVNIGYWGSGGYNFFSNHTAFRNQLQNTANYGASGTFKGIDGWNWINANSDINATPAAFSAAQLKAKYDMIVTGWQEMSAASAAKIKEYTDLGGVVFILMDAGEGPNLNVAFGGTSAMGTGVNGNQKARSLNNQISNGVFGTGGGATLFGMNESSRPPVGAIPPGSFITSYLNTSGSTISTIDDNGTEYAGVYITGVEGRAVFVYDEGIFRHTSVAGIPIDMPQEIFIHNLISYALQKVGFSAE